MFLRIPKFIFCHFQFKNVHQLKGEKIMVRTEIISHKILRFQINVIQKITSKLPDKSFMLAFMQQRWYNMDVIHEVMRTENYSFIWKKKKINSLISKHDKKFGFYPFLTLQRNTSKLILTREQHELQLSGTPMKH